MPNETFTMRFNDLAEDSGYSNRALGGELGVTGTAINHLRNGRNIASADLLCKIADRFGVTVDWLLGRDGFSK